MAEASVVAGASGTTSDQPAVVPPVGAVFRDIARGGIAGIIVGLLVGGLGGRLVMRLAAILHPNAAGIPTENGEVIGRITLEGTLALMVFGGLGMGFLAGTIWVIVGPWIPGRGRQRAIATALAAIALGTPNLIQRLNPDFVILDHDPLVVALLVGLVGLVGLSIALVDGALDARFPRPVSGVSLATAVYVLIAFMGLVLIVPVAIAILLNEREYRAPIRAGWALAVVGGCTLIWWVLRAKGRSEPPLALRLAGGISLLVAVGLGVVTSLPHILGAAGIR